MLRHATYKRNEKDFATSVIEDDSTGKVTMYVENNIALAATPSPTGGLVWTQSQFDALAPTDELIRLVEA